MKWRNRGAWIGVALGLVWGGCGNDGSPPEETSTSGGGAGGAATGGAGGTADLSACASDLQWSSGPVMSVARDHHATFGFTVGDTHHVYVTGGTNYTDIHDDVWRATLADDGTLMPWESLAAMPSARTGHAVATIGERVFLAGGQDVGTFLSEVIAADVQSDGTLSTWNTQTPLPGARFHLSMVATADHLYVTGGLTRVGRLATDTVYSAALDADGQLGEWTITNLPAARSHHASFMHDDHIYVAGGLVGNPAGDHTLYDDVWRAPIGQDGVIGTWELAGTLPAPRATHAAFTRGSCAYFLGGLGVTDRKADCVITPIEDSGMLGTGTLAAGLMPDARSHTHHVVQLGDTLVVVGGSVDLEQVTGASAIGQLLY